jgi:hypothetical protein
VEQAIRGKGDCRIRDINMMGVFCHTGSNEVLNSLHIKVMMEIYFGSTSHGMVPVTNSQCLSCSPFYGTFLVSDII